MEADIIINNLSRHKQNDSKYKEEIHKKQSKINQNNKNIMDYKKRINRTQNTTSIKSYYSKISAMESSNAKLQNDINVLMRKEMSEQKEINRLEKQLINTEKNNNNNYQVNRILATPTMTVHSNDVKISFDKAVNSFCKNIKKEGLQTKYGIISNIKDSGNQGGNGKILFGELNKRQVAIKVLFVDDKSKRNRFFDEFINVFMSLQKERGIVELYLYDIYEFEGIEISYIVMKKYNGNLVNNKPELNEENTIKLFFGLCAIIKKIHDVNIVHRDIKPENILVDDNNEIVISDFGIAFFDPEEYEYTGHTLYKEILGNRKFSPPEQANKGTEPHPTMDIFALGQVMQWFVTGDAHSGTGRKTLDKIINTNTMKALDKMIDRCLRADYKERYQNIDEIYDDLKKYGIKESVKIEKEVSLYEDDYEIEPNGLGLGDKIVVI